MRSLPVGPLVADCVSHRQAAYGQAGFETTTSIFQVNSGKTAIARAAAKFNEAPGLADMANAPGPPPRCGVGGFVGLPEPALSDEVPGCNDDGGSVHRRWSCRCQRVVHAGNLPGVQARDIEQTVGTDVQNGEGAVEHARRRAIHHFDDDAGQANALTGEVGNAGDIFLSEHAHEGRVGQRV